MNKIFISVIILFVSITNSNAQFQWGVKGGLNLSNFINSSLESSIKPSFHAGIAAQYFFTEHIGIESGIYYSVLGANEEIKFSNPETGVTFLEWEKSPNPSYLQMPLLFTYRVKLSPKLSLLPTGGMYFGCGVAGENEYLNISDDDGGTVILGNPSGYFNDQANRLDMGISAGLNFQYTHIICGIGYEQGLLKINKTAENPLNNKNLYNQNIKVSVGYLF